VRGNLLYRERGLAQQLTGDVEFHRIEQRAERGARGLEASVERAPVHRERGCDVVGVARVDEELAPDQPAHDRDEIDVAEGVHVPEALFELPERLRLGRAQRVLEPATIEMHRDGACIEDQGGAQAVAVRPHVPRLAEGQVHLERRPARAD